MLNGYRTYIMAGLMLLYNLASALGVVNDVSSQDFQRAADIVVNVVLGLLTIFFRAKAQPKSTVRRNP